MKVIEVKRSIFENNDKDAASLREQLKGEKTFLLNLMSSPGSGKTSTLVPTVTLQGITYVYPSLISSASSFGHVGRSFPPPRSSFVIVVERAGTKDYMSNV